MRISILITTMNRNQDLTECLESLCRQTVSPFEIIVVDNGPSQETEDLVHSFKNRLPICYFGEETRGVSFARNRALREARGSVVAYTDDDCVLEEHWVEEISRQFQPDGGGDVVIGMSLNYFTKNPVSQASFFYFKKWFDVSKNFFDTKNIAIRKSVIDERNLTFENPFSKFGCGEDITFGQRLLDDGISFHYNPKMIARHKEPTSLKALLKTRYRRGMMWYFMTQARDPGKIFDVKPGFDHRRSTLSLISDLGRPFSLIQRTQFYTWILMGYLAKNLGYWSSRFQGERR